MSERFKNQIDSNSFKEKNNQEIEKEIEGLKESFSRLKTIIKLSEGGVAQHDLNQVIGNIKETNKRLASQLIFDSFPDAYDLLVNITNEKEADKIKAELLKISNILWNINTSDSRIGQWRTDTIVIVDGKDDAIYDLDENRPGAKEDLLERANRALQLFNNIKKEVFSKNDISYLLDMDISSDITVDEVNNILHSLEGNNYQKASNY